MGGCWRARQPVGDPQPLAPGAHTPATSSSGSSANSVSGPPPGHWVLVSSAWQPCSPSSTLLPLAGLTHRQLLHSFPGLLLSLPPQYRLGIGHPCQVRHLQARASGLAPCLPDSQFPLGPPWSSRGGAGARVASWDLRPEQEMGTMGLLCMKPTEHITSHSAPRPHVRTRHPKVDKALGPGDRCVPSKHAEPFLKARPPVATTGLGGQTWDLRRQWADGHIAIYDLRAPIACYPI